ncbi:beta-ketoacyl synthase N-terminal-like domain-containing protein [Prauserella halophila]|nr:beta-ketoacyl synthase N-terminal-like domain-containing protein [Prauserella halophila]
MTTCFGDTDRTVDALLAGESGVAPLRGMDTEAMGVVYGYPIADGDESQSRASGWLTGVIRDATAGLELDGRRVAVVVGSGLRELRSLERWHRDGAAFGVRQLHFDEAVRAALPGVAEVLTVSNACSASGYALAVGMDLLSADEADVVVAAGTDSRTESMLTMIGKIGDELTAAVEPFDVDRTGVLLGEGAAAVVIEREARTPLGWIRSVGLTCDAHHETAPDQAGVVGAMRDAHERAGVTPADIGLVVAHGTGTALNDPTEAGALTETFGTSRPQITAIKGATGHTSGGASLMNTIVALTAMRTGTIPAVTGLRTPIEQAAGLNLVVGDAAPTTATLAQVDAFGFGGVNAVTVVEVA